MAKPFNGTSKDIRSQFRKWIDSGKSSSDFNEQFSSFTIDGRKAKGLRTEGLDKKGTMKIKINYTDTVNRYEGNRKRHEELSTPLDSDRKAGAKVFRDNKGNKGTDVDHIQRLDRTGRALELMTPKRQAKYHANMAEAGIPIGNDPRNLEVVPTGQNRATDAKEHKAIDKKLKSMEKQQKSPTLVQLEKTGTTSGNRRINFSKGVKNL